MKLKLRVKVARADGNLAITCWDLGRANGPTNHSSSKLPSIPPSRATLDHYHATVAYATEAAVSRYCVKLRDKLQNNFTRGLTFGGLVKISFLFKRYLVYHKAS